MKHGIQRQLRGYMFYGLSESLHDEPLQEYVSGGDPEIGHLGFLVRPVITNSAPLLYEAVVKLCPIALPNPTRFK